MIIIESDKYYKGMHIYKCVNKKIEKEINSYINQLEQSDYNDVMRVHNIIKMLMDIKNELKIEIE